MDQTVSWFAMPIGVQISNVGSEVHRAIRWKNRGDEQKRNGFCLKAIEFLELMKKDPKNQYRKGELDCCINELQDYLMGENVYNTTEEQLTKYYDAFL
ncbi:MAG: hypothetical protein NC311_09420 [Muribaculaceae bacterium]|nr:hypothetical protein [Muribaculaceae bacterium]